jgi:hypothetical protein
VLALRYPKTIARDILITTSQHPFQRGLNAHLEQLTHRFTKIDDLADFFTIRWNLLDPGGASIGSANMSPTPNDSSNKYSQTPSSKNLAVRNSTLPIDRGALKPTRGSSSLRGRRGSGRKSNQASLPYQPSGLRFSSTAELKSDFAVIVESDTPAVVGEFVSLGNGRSRC